MAEGRAGVQDEGSQLVAMALAAAPVDGRGRALARPVRRARAARPRCSPRWPRSAAPGCWPASGSRTGPGWCARALAGADGVLGVVAADGTAPAVAAPARFDRVLVDAPCTGLGALRRRPEARWRRKADDLPALVPLQRALLDSALDARPARAEWCSTRPARRCSPRPRAWSASVLADRAPTPRSRTPPPLLPGVPELRRRRCPGTVQLWPHRHGTDAMFMALFRKSLSGQSSSTCRR